jgi:hypothetical protein
MTALTTHTEIDNYNLSPWYFAVRYASLALQNRITNFKEKEWDTTYDEHVLKNLTELEQFLKMSWDTWMDELETSIKSKQEVK